MQSVDAGTGAGSVQGLATELVRVMAQALARVQEPAWGVRQHTAQDFALGSARRWARPDGRPGSGKRGRQRSIVMYDVSGNMKEQKCAT